MRSASVVDGSAGARRVHVIINPSSGRATAELIWAQVRGHLAVADITPVSVYRTKCAGDATRYAQQELSLEEGDVVAAVGGDGTMNEVVNGLMRRADAAAKRYTLCFIPAGSANTLAFLTGCNTAQRAAAAIAAGKTRPMDLYAFYQSGDVKYGFLACYTGMFADVDIDSDVFRWLGPIRFPAYTVMKIACCGCCGCVLPDHSRCTYRVRVRWAAAKEGRPGCGDKPPTAPRMEPSAKWSEFEGDVQFLQLMSVPYMDPTMKAAPDARMDDGLITVQFATPVNRVALAGQFGQIESGVHLAGRQWTCEKAESVVVEVANPRDKVVLDGELVCRGKRFQVEPMPGFVNVIVGDQPPGA